MKKCQRTIFWRWEIVGWHHDRGNPERCSEMNQVFSSRPFIQYACIDNVRYKVSILKNWLQKRTVEQHFTTGKSRLRDWLKKLCLLFWPNFGRKITAVSAFWLILSKKAPIPAAVSKQKLQEGCFTSRKPLETLMEGWQPVVFLQ